MTLRVGVLLEGNSTGATRSIVSVREAMADLTRTASESSSALRKGDIDAYGKQLDGLRARYNPLFATIQRYKAEVTGIRNAHQVGAISTDEMAEAITRGRQAALASIAAIKSRNAALDEEGSKLDALRARYNPLFATIQRYKGELASIRDAHRLGAISADEMAAAISRQRQAALSSIAAIKGRATSVTDEAAQLDALRARYNPLFATIQRYKAEIAAIRDANRLGAISADEMAAAITRQRQATLASIAAIKERNAAMAAPRADGPDAAQLEALRARYNPLYAAVRQYRTELTAIRDAHRLGAISADEMAAAISRERQAALGSIAALKQRNVAIAETPVAPAIAQTAVNNRFNSANIAAQFQDIAVTSQMGMNPLQIALQQGTQLSAVFNELKASGQGLGTSLMAAFTSIVNPVSLVTIGIVAAAAAAIQFGSTLFNVGDQAEKAFEDHVAWLDELLEGYGKAKDAAKAAIDEARKLPQGAVESEAAADLKRQQESLKKALEAFRNYSASLVSDAYAEAYLPPDQQKVVAQFAGEFAQLQAQINGTPAKLAAVVTRLTEIKNSGAPEVVRQTAQSMLALAKQADQVAGSVAAAAAAVNAFAAPTFRGLGVAEQLEEIKRLTPDLRTAREQVADLFAAAAGEARTTTELQTLTQAVLDFNTAMDARDAADQAAKDKAAADRLAAQVSDYDRSIEQIRERTRSLQTESNVVGLSTFAAERYRITLELEAAARKDAAGLTTARIEQIRAEANAYAAAAAQQEAIAERQKQFQEQVSSYRQTFTGFFSDLYRAQSQGAQGWDAWRQAGANALDSIGQRAAEMAANGIFDMILGAVGGALGGGFGVGKGLTGAATYGFSGLGSYGIPGLATGGEVLRGGWTMVGENGPERVYLPGGARVMNSSDSRAMAAAGGGGTVVQLIDQRSSGRVEQQRTRGPNGEEIIRAIVRDELPAAYGDAVRRSRIG